MYYILESDILVWRRSELYANLKGEMPEYEPHWWDCVPLSIPLPLLSFEVNTKAPMPDNYWNGDIISLHSKRLIEYIGESGVNFEIFPAILIDRKTRQPSPVTYSVFHLLELHDALDLEQSKFVKGRTAKIVLRPECLESKVPLFRVKERRNLILIHQELKSMFDSANITGFVYIPVNEYHSLL